MTGHEVSDAALVIAAQHGQLTALATLFDRHRAGLYAAAIGLLRDPHEAADAVQDTFVTALTRIHTVHDPAAIRGWLRAVAQNACLMRLRQRRPVYVGELPDRADPGHDPDRLIEARFARDAIWASLRSLTEEERITLVLRHFSRCPSYAAIAEVTAVPVGTVRSRLHRAHQRLADALQAQAGSTSHDQQRLESERRANWEGFYEVVLHAPEPRTYRPLFHDDVQVREWATTWTGIHDWIAVERPAIELGVTASVVAVLAAHDITVLEIDFTNPPEAPDHCPPRATFVHRLNRGRTSHLAIHHA